MEGLHLFQLDSGCAGGKKGDRALSEKSSSLSKVQAEAALKWGHGDEDGHMEGPIQESS